MSPSGSNDTHAAVPDRDFYQTVIERLDAHRIPFLVGGAYAFHRHTGIERHTRDFDVFVLPEHGPLVLERLAADGYRTWMAFPHWLGKIGRDESYVDIIFSSGNGLGTVDAEWFEHSRPSQVLGHDVRLCPIEEMIWQKAFIMERERFDGADVLHLLRAGAERMDWPRLLRRFGPHGRVLLAHLVLFGYVYPAERGRIPQTVFDRLLAGLDEPAPEDPHLSRGTLLSRSQYLSDLDRGLHDARLAPVGPMCAQDIARWTAAADEPPPRG